MPFFFSSNTCGLSKVTFMSHFKMQIVFVSLVINYVVHVLNNLGYFIQAVLEFGLDNFYFFTDLKMVLYIVSSILFNLALDYT